MKNTEFTEDTKETSLVRGFLIFLINVFGFILVYQVDYRLILAMVLFYVGTKLQKEDEEKKL